MQHAIFEKFYEIGVVPVLEIDSVNRAVHLAESLRAGGLPVGGSWMAKRAMIADGQFT